ncbi:hypothetical protein EVAR_24213_1 [Eumeta japonica]|uniref:RNA-directed DNA polymerase from transposon X-element n=1 Tax=Eumeta variegata TaxID=151549 RepID=A0A4C1W542_EUMVA|nr:hypothetical protein EVAR_24213_1 [Eumeta japonica]
MLREAQSKVTTLLPAPISRRGDLPPSIKTRHRRKLSLRKLWTRLHCPKLKSELNNLLRRIFEAVRDLRGATWETTIDRAGENSRKLNQFWD